MPQPPPRPVPSIHSRGRQSPFPAAAGKGGKKRKPPRPAAATARLCTRGPRQCPGPTAPPSRAPRSAPLRRGGRAGRRRARRRGHATAHTLGWKIRGNYRHFLPASPLYCKRPGRNVARGCLRRSPCKETNTALALALGFGSAGGSPPPGKGQPRLEKYRYFYERRLPGSFLQLPLPWRGAAELSPCR